MRLLPQSRDSREEGISNICFDYLHFASCAASKARGCVVRQCETTSASPRLGCEQACAGNSFSYDLILITAFSIKMSSDLVLVNI